MLDTNAKLGFIDEMEYRREINHLRCRLASLNEALIKAQGCQKSRSSRSTNDDVELVGATYLPDNGIYVETYKLNRVPPDPRLAREAYAWIMDNISNYPDLKKCTKLYYAGKGWCAVFEVQW